MSENIENIKIIADKCIKRLADGGAARAICSASKSVTNEFNVDGGQFSLFRTLFDNSLSITAYVDNKKGTASLNKFDDGSIEAAVKSCIASAQAAEPDEAWEIAPKQPAETFIKGCPDADIDKFFERTKEFMKDIQERYPLIIMEQLIVSHTRTEAVYVNTNGTEFDTISGQYSVSAMFSAHEGENASSFFGDGVIIDNLDRPFIELGTFADSFDKIQKQVVTEPLSGKFAGTVVAPPSLLVELLTSALENFAGDFNLLSGTSIWNKALGTKVADDRLSVAIAPLDGRIVSGQRFTAEGYKSENYYVIKDGILENFMLSQYVANKTGNRRAPNSASNMIIEGGDISIDDMIKGIKKGILAGRFSGGAPGINGDFSGVAKNSFLIEDGKITKALSETMISGNLADILKNISCISRETFCDGNSVLPYIAFEGVTVSGK